MTPLITQVRVLLPGLTVCAVVAVAATFLSAQHGAPVMLMALLLGMALNFLSGQSPTHTGIDFAARQVLRAGVALLGLRVTLDQVGGLGWSPWLMVISSVVVVLLASGLLTRALGLRAGVGVLAGGAVAICGASAALALAAALPRHPDGERDTLVTVIGVSVLSTLAMVLYPPLLLALGLNGSQAGAFLGGTIHDVAQVVGAGYSLSHEAGDTAAVVKLMRVAMLVPVVLLLGLVLRGRPSMAGQTQRPPLLPWFVLAFVALVLLQAVLTVPPFLLAWGQGAAQWCLALAMAAIGMKTHLGELARVGLRPVLLLVALTGLLAAWVLGWVRVVG